MTEEAIKQNITNAFGAPPPSQQLVERTVQRGLAIENGRAAERALAAGTELTRAEVVRYTAQGVVGRVMLNQRMPAGVTAAEMAQSLAENEKFASAVPQSPEKALSQVRSGSLIKKTAEPAKTPNTPEHEKTRSVGADELSL